MPSTFKYYRIFIFLFISSLAAPEINAFDSVIDSLKGMLEIKPDGPEKVDLMVELSGAYYSGPEAMEWARKALDLSKELNNIEKIALSLRQIGWSHYTVFELDSATYYADKALQQMDGTDYLNALFAIYNLKVAIFIDYKQLDIAEFFCSKAYDISKKDENLENQAKILNTWGIILYESGRLEEALEKHSSSLKISYDLNNEMFVGRSYHNLAMTAKGLGRFKESSEYFLKAIDLRNQIGHYNGQAESQTQMADLFFNMRAEGVDESDYLQEIQSSGFRDPFHLLDSSLNLPRIKENVGIQLFNMVYQVKGHKQARNFEKALEILERQKSVEDSLRLTDANLGALADLKIQYEKELLLAANKIKDSEIRRQKAGQLLLAALSFILLGISLFIYIYFKQKRKIRILHHHKQIDRHLNLIEQLQFRISSILDHKTSAIELRPLPALNDFLNVQITQKEYEVLKAIALGLSNKEVAKHQFISENTVKYHLKNIFFKLQVVNRKEAVKRLLSLT